jgi:hypothetical protein
MHCVTHGGIKWTDGNKLRLLMAILETNQIEMTKGKWDIVAEKVGGGVTAHAAR